MCMGVHIKKKTHDRKNVLLLFLFLLVFFGLDERIKPLSTVYTFHKHVCQCMYDCKNYVNTKKRTERSTKYERFYEKFQRKKKIHFLCAFRLSNFVWSLFFNVHKHHFGLILMQSV